MNQKELWGSSVRLDKELSETVKEVLSLKDDIQKDLDFLFSHRNVMTNQKLSLLVREFKNFSRYDNEFESRLNKLDEKIEEYKTHYTNIKEFVKNVVDSNFEEV